MGVLFQRGAERHVLPRPAAVHGKHLRADCGARRPQCLRPRALSPEGPFFLCCSFGALRSASYAEFVSVFWCAPTRPLTIPLSLNDAGHGPGVVVRQSIFLVRCPFLCTAASRHPYSGSAANIARFLLRWCIRALLVNNIFISISQSLSTTMTHAIFSPWKYFIRDAAKPPFKLTIF